MGMTCLAIHVILGVELKTLSLERTLQTEPSAKPKTLFVNSSKVKVEELVFTHKSEERGGECESSQK